MLDIVVTAYGCLDLTHRCVSALTLFAPEGSRIILVDNSPAGTESAECLREPIEKAGGVYIRRDGENLGIYACWNLGIAAGSNPLVALVSNDIVVMPWALARMCAGVSAEQPIISATPVSGTGFNFSQVLTAANVRGEAPDQYVLGDNAFFPCVVMHRDLFRPENAGLFDERFMLSFGDTDWAMRLLYAGIRSRRSTGAIAFHGEAVTRKRGGFKRDFDRNEADQTYFLEKWADNEAVCLAHGRPDPDAHLAVMTKFFAENEQ